MYGGARDSSAGELGKRQGSDTLPVPKMWILDYRLSMSAILLVFSP